MTERKTGGPTRPGFVPVCAIGASAGGVGVLQTLFRLLPDDLGLAYVVVVHMAPGHPSAMHEILAASTRMPVFEVADGPTLRADCVYVIAPDSEITIDGDEVRARPFTDPRGRRAPIDMFFRSVAAACGDGIAVVLTGAGADGAVGVRAIKEAGGIVMVQEPAEAGFPSMPQNAIATGVADVVAPVARLAERIAEAARSKEAVRSLDEDGAAHDLRRIVAFLRTRTGHDFSGYKRATVLRRVTRRMQVCQLASLDDYARHLRSTPEEAKALFADLLISVTMFFRDPAAFEVLATRVVHPLLEQAGEDQGDGEIRAWVVGCATGEEAYSLAILLLEEADRLKLHVPLQIFSTDLDEGALATAREGRYPRSIEADVSPDRLKRYFVDEGTHYRVSRRVRDLVLFATHSVVREPPFLRLDLVTCRNVLIYLERMLQQHVCAIFHYGLKPGGALFLGTAETADIVQDQFVAVDREARIYRAVAAGGLPVPVLLPAASSGTLRPSAVMPGRAAAQRRFEAGDALGASHATALEASAPPSALVDAEQGVLHLSPTVGRFILLSAGPLSGRLSSIVRPELRLDLKLALDRAFDTGQPSATRYIDVGFDKDMRRVSAHVHPLRDGEGRTTRAVVYFHDNGPSRSVGTAETLSAPDEMRQLHGELKAAQEAALAGRIGHEAALQELRASNEELQSLNEEYRSTAEELETSKEELQSINEELQTVNAELKTKLTAISAAHDDLQNLTASSEIGTLFLDTGLRIRMFTPRVAEVINITQADVGRPITDFTHRLDYGALERDVRRVLRDLQPIEAEVRGLGERWFTLRVRPYRTLDDKVEGAVVTLDDITARKRGADALRVSEAKYRGLFSSIDTGFCVIEVVFDEDGRPVDYVILEANPAFAAQTGLVDTVGERVRSLVPGHEQFWFDTYGRIARTGQPERFEHRADALGRWYDVYAFRVGEPGQDQVAVLFNDIVVRKRSETALRESEALQRVLIEGTPQIVWRASPDGAWAWASPQWTGYTGQAESESRGDGWRAALHPDDFEHVEAAWSMAARGEPLDMEVRIRHAASGAYRWFQSRALPVRGESGAVVEWLGTSTDVDDLRRLQDRQTVLVAELQHRTHNLMGVVSAFADATLQSSSDLQDFAGRFRQRIAALSRVQGLLARLSEGERVTFDELLRSELTALGGAGGEDQIALEGPHGVALRSSTVQTFALAIHELATNAVKYGALKQLSGRLRVAWRLEPPDAEGRPWLHVDWHETGVAMPSADAAPSGTGQGRDLIENALPYQLGAKTSFTLAADGVRCSIAVPVSSRARRGGPGGGFG